MVVVITAALRDNIIILVFVFVFAMYYVYRIFLVEVNEKILFFLSVIAGRGILIFLYRNEYKYEIVINLCKKWL